jgi:hypothetical protein
MATMTDRDEELEDIDDLVWELERGIQQATGAVQGAVGLCLTCNDAAIRALVQNKGLAQFKNLQNVEDELHQIFDALRALMVSR